MGEGDGDRASDYEGDGRWCQLHNNVDVFSASELYRVNGSNSMFYIV